MLTLNESELRDVTQRTRTDAQRRVLDALGIRYRIRPDGSLVVLRANVERELGGLAGTMAAREPQLRP